MKHSLRELEAMATIAPPAPTRISKAGNVLLAKYRSMRSSLDRSTCGDAEALRKESREISDSLREERASANSLLLKRK